MPKPFAFVNKFQGSYIPYTQDGSLAAVWKQKFPGQPFTGACMGMSLSLVQAIMAPDSTDEPHNLKGVRINLPKPAKSVVFQKFYEQDHENYPNILVRNVLQQQGVAVAFPEEHSVHGADLIPYLHDQERNNMVLIMNLNLQFTVLPSRQVIPQMHALTMIKKDNLYCFCDPTHGIAIFQNKNAFYDWLNTELKKGVLNYLVAPVEEKIIIDSNQNSLNAKVLHGVKECINIHSSAYLFDGPRPRSRL